MRLRAAGLERLAGSLIVAGFEGVTPPADVLSDVRRGSLGGIILFKRNVEDAKQVFLLLEHLRAAAPREAPLIAGVDQEGGRVIRLDAPLIALPPARRFGELGDPELTERAGLLVGRELAALGFTVDFAPVLDVDTNPSSPVIGDRSFGSTPERVVRHALPFARGLRLGGVWPCAKHFPGHGDAELDSHLSLPIVEHHRKRLEQVEMAPFAAWSRARLGAVMTAHVRYPALDALRPATTSRTIVTDELVDRLGFDGPIFTDDIEMGAVREMGGAGEVAVCAIRAGAHGLLVCRHEETRRKVLEALAAEAMADALFAERLASARRRLAPLSRQITAVQGFAWIDSEEHQRMKEEVVSATSAVV